MVLGNKIGKVSPDFLRDELLENIHVLCTYWANLEGITPIKAAEGIAFSILTMLDGCSGGVPNAYDLVARVSEEDEDQSREGVVISDMLHEYFYP